jgi:hypothetical protein
MKTQIKQKFSGETKLYALWRGLCLAKKMTKNRRLRGIYPGRLNTTCGPDYQSAEFDLDGKRYRGDVEIHQKILDWNAHGHHLDWRYDNVLLHLTAEATNEKKKIYNSKGLDIPTLSFQDFPILKCTDDAEYKCVASVQTKEISLTDYKRFAMYRFKEKVNTFRRVVTGDGFAQGIYRSSFRMLGRGQNSDLYDRIALMLPWSTIQQLKYKYHPDLAFWQNILLMIAGFTPGIQAKVKSIPGVTDQPSIPKHAWQLAGLRPPAHPVQRLKGMAEFIFTLKCDDPFEHILALSMHRISFEKLLDKFRLMLCINKERSLNNYWGEHLGLEIIANVYLPALYYYSELSGSEGFLSYIDDFYEWLPATPLYSILRGFETWPEFSDLPQRFYIRQAFLWLRENYCQINLCDHCPMHRQPERV